MAPRDSGYGDLLKIDRDAVMKGVCEKSWNVFYRDCPGTIMEEMRKGVPWFGIKLSWIRIEFAFRLMVLLDANVRERARNIREDAFRFNNRPEDYLHIFKCEARSKFGPPHFLLNDLFQPMLTRVKSMDGITETEQYWQFRYLIACFRYRFRSLIKKIFWLGAF